VSHLGGHRAPAFFRHGAGRLGGDSGTGVALRVFTGDFLVKAARSSGNISIIRRPSMNISLSAQRARG
jgi:hypothetical protein